MFKRIFAAFLMTSMLLLTGCQLAKPQAAPKTPVSDRLAGVLVTREHLDLFDMEGYLNDHLNECTTGDHVITDTSGYEGRIYGKLIPTGQLEDGAVKYEVSFPDVEGYFLVELRVSASGIWEEGEEYYWNTTGNGGFYDLKSGFTATDDGEKTDLEMTLAYWQDGPVTMFVNPVYQTDSGEIYVTSGSGLTGDLTAGGEMTQTLTNDVTAAVDGVSRSATSTVRVHAVHALLTQELRLIQMDENHQVISEKAYGIGTFPEELTPEQNTAYLIAEISDGESVKRSIFQPGDENIPYFVAQGDLAVPEGIRLHWSE